jgi:hypothetical protein
LLHLAFATASPGFQCDQAYVSAPDNAKSQPRNPRFEITKSFFGGLFARPKFCNFVIGEFGNLKT